MTTIPRATWHDYPPAIEFESTDLPMEVVRELASLALNQINVRIRRGDVMSITDTQEDAGVYTFFIGPDAPETRVYGPDVVTYHNEQTAPKHRQKPMIAYARRLAELTRLDET